MAPPSPTYGSGSSPSTAYYSLFSIFPADPGRVLESRTFRVHWGNRRTHRFTVWRGDGYHTVFTPEAPPTDYPYPKETIEHWDDAGHPALNPLDVAVFTASIDPDPTRTWWLRDDTTGQTFPLRQSDVFDGWQPMHLEPPPEPVLTVDLYAGRRTDSFVLDWHGVPTAPFPPVVDSSSTLLVQNAAGEYLYELPYVTFSLTDPRPYAPGPITLTDTTTNESRTLQRGENDLIEWLSPPKTINLHLSSSRWDASQHTLVLHQSNGESWPVEKVATAGDTSSSPTFLSWTNSYFYFEATAPARVGLDWWLEDTNTGEITALNPTNESLLAWDFVAAPASLTGALTPDSSITIQWPRGSSSADGAFEVERRCDSGLWFALERVQVNAASPAATVSFTDGLTVFGCAYRYRVRSVFGAAKSAPSPVLYIGGLLDSDGDGLTDAEELEIAANPLLDPELQADSDGDGVSDAQEMANGTNPNDAYDGIPPQLDALSGENQTGLPNRFYPAPLVLKVMKSGTPLIGVPVSVEAGPNGGRIAQDMNGKRIGTSLVMVTDQLGLAKFYLEAPAASGNQFFVARAGLTNRQVSVQVDYAIGPPAPQNITSEWMGTGTRLQWDPLGSPPGRLEVERSIDQKVWKVVQILAGTAVSYYDNYVSVSPTVYYRITSLPTPP